MTKFEVVYMNEQTHVKFQLSLCSKPTSLFYFILDSKYHTQSSMEKLIGRIAK